MLRWFVLLAFAALVGLGVSLEHASSIVTDVAAAEEGCPCEDDSGDDECCATASCACFATHAAGLPQRAWMPGQRESWIPGSGWAIGAEQRVSELSRAPPTPPPIG